MSGNSVGEVGVEETMAVRDRVRTLGRVAQSGLRIANSYAGLLAVIAAVVGFALVYLQIGAARKDLVVAGAAAEYQNLAAMDRMLVDYPEVRPYFEPTPGAPALDWNALTGTQRERVLSVAEAMMDFVDYQPAFGVAATSNRQAWEFYYTALFARSQIMRDLLSQRCDWYDLAQWDAYWHFYSRVPGVCAKP